MAFLKDRLIVFLIVLVGTTISINSPLDPDFGWHYKYGEYIFQNQKILKDNIYSYTLPDYEWANSYWFSQLIMYALVSSLGVFGASALMGIVLSLSVYFSMLKDLSSSIKLFYGAAILTVLGAFNVTVRPLYFSTLFMLALVYVLRSKKEYIKYLPLLFLFWANMHADFLLGLFVFGIYTLQKLYENKNYIINKADSFFVKFRKLVSISCPLVTSILATCLNPFGIELWTTLINEINNVTFGMIKEMSPVSLSFSLQVTLPLHVFLALILAASFFNIKRNGKDIWLFILILFFFALSAKAAYFYRVFFILGFFSLSEVLLFIQKLIPLEKTPSHLKKAVTVSMYYFSFALFAVVLNLFVTNMAEAKTKEQENYPANAIEHINRAAAYKGNMFNEYDWGGYLIMNLPEHKTYIDGRMASWRLPNGSFLLKRYMKIIKKPYDNVAILNEDFEKYNIKWALLKKDSKLVDYLEKEKGWIKTFEDETATVVATRTP